MTERDYSFTRKGVVAGDSIEIPHGPWLLWGHAQIAVARANPMPENRSAVSYEGWVRLSRSPFVRLGIESLDPESYTKGDTPVALPEGFDFAGGPGPGSLAFTFERNENGRLSHLRFPHINAPSIDVALDGIRGLANQVVWSLTVATHQALFIDGILVRSQDMMEIRSRSNVPAPEIELTAINPMLMLPALRPFMSQYVEGVRSSSPFYSFLCFFKVCESMNHVRSKLRKLFEKHGLEPPALNGTFPEEPIASLNKQMVGKKYTSAIPEYQSVYRNGIAHFSPGDRLEPLVELKNEDDVAIASRIMRWAASDLITQTAQALSTLKEAGSDIEQLTLT